MSYEGRIVYICSNGHIIENDAMNDFEVEEKDGHLDIVTNPKDRKCPFCGGILEHIGAVDDTNGESAAGFYKKVSRKHKSERVIEGSGKDAIVLYKIYPEIGEIVKGKADEVFNYDTGEKYNW